MHTERATSSPWPGYAVAAAIASVLALWQVGSLELTQSPRPSAGAVAAIGPAPVAQAEPQSSAVAEAAAADWVPADAAMADDVDAQLESSAAMGAIAAELEGDASPR